MRYRHYAIPLLITLLFTFSPSVFAADPANMQGTFRWADAKLRDALYITDDAALVAPMTALLDAATWIVAHPDDYDRSLVLAAEAAQDGFLDYSRDNLPEDSTRLNLERFMAGAAAHYALSSLRLPKAADEARTHLDMLLAGEYRFGKGER